MSDDESYLDPVFSMSLPSFQAPLDTVLSLKQNQGSLTDREFCQLLKECKIIVAKWDSASTFASRRYFREQWKELCDTYFQLVGVLPSGPPSISPSWDEIRDNYAKIGRTSPSDSRSKGAPGGEPDTFYYWAMLAYLYNTLWYHYRRETYREQTELAYAFASKVVIECSSTTDTNICLAFCQSFMCFLEDAVIVGPTETSLLLDTLSTLSSMDMGDPDLVTELLTMKNIVTNYSDIHD